MSLLVRATKNWGFLQANQQYRVDSVSHPILKVPCVVFYQNVNTTQVMPVDTVDTETYRLLVAQGVLVAEPSSGLGPAPSLKGSVVTASQLGIKVQRGGRLLEERIYG